MKERNKIQESKLIKHWTASVFVFGKHHDEWKLLLLLHPKLRKWMIPGGHLEKHENPAEAAVREVFEETGLEVRFFSLNATNQSACGLLSYVPLPELIVEEVIPMYKQEPEHIHIDCLYAATAGDTEILSTLDGVTWVSSQGLMALDMFPETRKIALEYFDACQKIKWNLDGLYLSYLP